MFRIAVILALCMLALTPPRVCTCAHSGRVAERADDPADVCGPHDHDHGDCCHDHEDHDSAPPCHHDDGRPCRGHDDGCPAVTDASPAMPAQSATPAGPADLVPLLAPALLPRREPAAVATVPPDPAPPSAPVYLVCCSLRR